MRGDIREARSGMVFITAPDGTRRTDGAFLDDMTGRIIRLMLVAWSLPLPMPRERTSEDLAERILDGLDDDTYSALEEAVAPWVNRIITIGKTSAQLIHTATGETVDVAEPDKAARLLASGAFTAVDAPGPKARHVQRLLLRNRRLARPRRSRTGPNRV